MLRIEQDSEYQGAGYWKWSVWIEAPDAELDEIASVEYDLHPTFPNPVRLVDDRETKFRLETAGWGEFLLYATATRKDGRTVELEHELKLSRPDWPEPVEKEFAVPPPEPEPPVPAEDGAAQADAFFEGPMFGGIAFAGALEGARAAGGITRWGRVGGASGGALVAALLVVGYDVDEIRALLMSVNLSGLARWRLGWARVLAVLRLFYGRGLFSPDRIEAWLEEVLTAKVGHSPTFADVTDPENASEAGPAQYRLRLLATDLTTLRLIILPDDLGYYRSSDGEPLDPETFPLARAVRMSMCSAVFFEPTPLLDEDGRRHDVVDGGVLSPFPVWLFDRPRPSRPTWGFLVTAPDDPATYRSIPRFFGVYRLSLAMLRGIMRTRDRGKMTRSDAVRTVGIPSIPGGIGPDMSLSDAEKLFEQGRRAALDFFGVQREYVNSYGLGSETVIVPAAAHSST